MRTLILLATLVSMLLMPFAVAKEPKSANGARDGSSVEKAILVRGGIKPEKAWITQHFHCTLAFTATARLSARAASSAITLSRHPMGSIAKYISTRAITSDASRFQSLTPRDEARFDLYLMLTDLTKAMELTTSRRTTLFSMTTFFHPPPRSPSLAAAHLVLVRCCRTPCPIPLMS